MSRCLTYGGDVTEGLVGIVMGPDTAGAWSVVVACDYDPARDVTTIAYRPLLPSEVTMVVTESWGRQRLVRRVPA